MSKPRVRGRFYPSRREWLGAFATVALAGCLSSGNTGTPNDEDGEGNESGTETTASPERDSHPSIESELYGLVTADDREAYAERRGIELDDGRVMVTLELEPEDAEVPPEADVESRFGGRANAWVHVDSVVAVAEYEQVRFVRFPDESVQGLRGVSR